MEDDRLTNLRPTLHQTLLTLDSFLTKNFVAGFEINQLLYEKWPICTFEPPLSDLGTTYAVHLMADWKVDLLLVIIEKIALGALRLWC